jgi:hypothetical protein
MRRALGTAITVAAVVAAFAVPSLLGARPPAAAAAADLEPAHWARALGSAKRIDANLSAQPDVRNVTTTLFAPEGRAPLAVVQIGWIGACPAPSRLEAVARWARGVLGSEWDVHVLTSGRRCALVGEAATHE